MSQCDIIIPLASGRCHPLCLQAKHVWPSWRLGAQVGAGLGAWGGQRNAPPVQQTGGTLWVPSVKTAMLPSSESASFAYPKMGWQQGAPTGAPQVEMLGQMVDLRATVCGADSFYYFPSQTQLQPSRILYVDTKAAFQIRTMDELFRTWITEALAIDNHGQDGSSSTTPTKEKTNTDVQYEARSFFQTVTSRHEQALAQLIQGIGPVFLSKSLPAHLRGLYILLGAIEGCHDKRMSNSSVLLIGNFFCVTIGPVADEDYEEDYDSMIRDMSMKCLSALVETSAPTTSIETLTSKIDESTTLTDNEEDFVEAFQIRLSFAKRGVELRCATPDDMNLNDEIGIDNGDTYHDRDIRGGLSTMPRSKRSLCFNLLRNAVIGTSKVLGSAQPLLRKQIQQQQSAIACNIQGALIPFAEFIAQCIHGESDPRCLLQLLELLNTTQVNFHTWFLCTNTQSVNFVFPNEDFFDAVAPYYPIQFTPPPNNIHGITREALHSALISVLTFTQMDGSARRYRQPTMLGCSINLFLEQLLPGQSDEDNPSVLEKIESLECISNLIFPTDDKNLDQVDGLTLYESECTNLTFDEIRNLSKTLIVLHDEASIEVTHEGGDLNDQNKRLAENCRILASRVARDLERCNKDRAQGLWERFVSEPVEKEIKKLKLTPSYAKTSIAYEASLAASGGPRTLRVCLSKGLGPLLDYLRGHLHDSNDNTIAAIHGITAFLSSSRITLSKSRNEGVELIPHPLEPYAKDTCNLLFEIIEDEISPDIIPLKAAASSCLECLFMSCIASDLESEKLSERICNFLNSLLKTIIGLGETEVSKNEGEFDQYCTLSSNVLGRIIGVSLTALDDDKYSKDLDSRSVLLTPMVRNFVRTEIFPNLKAAAFANRSFNRGQRFDRMALSMACSSSPSLASMVVGAHLEVVLDALRNDISSPSSKTCLEALSYMLRSCIGDNAFHAFHESEMVDDIIDMLCHELTNSASSELRESISQVALIATEDNNETMKSKIKTVKEILSSLLPAYSMSVPLTRIQKLVKAISDKIPPLSQADEGILIVRLPILSAALNAAEPSQVEEVVSEIDGDGGLQVAQLIEGLTEYALSDDHLPDSRNAAAVCVYTLIKSGFNKNLDCPAKPLLNCINNRLSSSCDIRVARICFEFLSLISSASAIRGASSLTTADGIARFLMEAACEDYAKPPFCFSEDTFFNISVLFEEDYEQTALKLIAASAYGAILMEDGVKPLIKQRLIHVCIKYIKKSLGKGEESDSVRPSQVGLLMIVCYVICGGDLLKFDSATIHTLATLLINGFSTDLFQTSSQITTKLASNVTKARMLVVSALLKILCVAPKAVNGHILEIVSGLLRLYAISDPSVDVGCKLITLQALQALAHLDNAKDSILAVKPAVIAILSSSMSQKNVILRSAAVDVKNMWCLVA